MLTNLCIYTSSHKKSSGSGNIIFGGTSQSGYDRDQTLYGAKWKHQGFVLTDSPRPVFMIDWNVVTSHV